MRLSATRAKELILSGNIEGDHEVIQDLNMSGCTIPTWPCWKFKNVDLRNARIKKIGGSMTFLNCTGSTLEEIDSKIQVGRNENGNSAFFANCKNLSKVQGSFAGYTWWGHAGIQEIDPNTIFGTDTAGNCVSFEACKQLLKAQGNFPGFTDWTDSGIIEIDPKTKFGASIAGNSANFSNCTQLQKARGTFPGFTNWNNSGIKEIDPKTKLGDGNDPSGGSARFTNCRHLNPVTFAPKPLGTIFGNITFIPKAQALDHMEF